MKKIKTRSPKKDIKCKAYSSKQIKPSTLLITPEKWNRSNLLQIKERNRVRFLIPESH